jgi:cold shock CspA family protein
VQWFSVDNGYGTILDDTGDSIMLRFTGIPGLGYRTVQPGTEVAYEIVKSPTWVRCAINVQVIRGPAGKGQGSLTSGIVSGLNQ